MPDWASRDSQPSRLVYLPDAVAAVKAAFAAGRAAASPDPPDDWTAAILTLRRAMCTPAGREQVERELIRPFAASPDERLREVMTRVNHALLLIADDAPEPIGEAIDGVRAEIKDALAAADRDKPEACEKCNDTGMIPDPDRGSGWGPYYDSPCSCGAVSDDQKEKP